MKLRILTVATLLLTMTWTALPARALPKADMVTLNAQLQQAICTENWEEATKLVDQMIAITPSSDVTQRDTLEAYKQMMQNLSISRTNVDSWLESYCAAPTQQASNQSNCDPAYPGVCIPNSPEDLNCGDVTYRGFKALPEDPHGFDGDGDGIACEG